MDQFEIRLEAIKLAMDVAHKSARAGDDVTPDMVLRWAIRIEDFVLSGKFDPEKFDL